METPDKMEQEINLGDLFWKILFRWRQVIFWGVFFAVLMGGIKFLKDIRAYHKTENMDLEQKESELSEEEMQQVIEARNLKTRMEEYERYLDKSVLMKIDPYKKPVVELQYYVDSEYTFNFTQESQKDYTDDLVALYYNYILSGEMSEKLIEATGLSVDQENISELWQVSQVGGSISIKVACPEENQMEDVARLIKEQLSKKEKELQSIEVHELKLLGESKNVVVDAVLSDRKNAISTSIVNLNAQLNNLKSGMTEQQINLIDNEEVQEESDSVRQVITKPRLNVKYIVLGAIFGIFLVCAWVVYEVAFNAKLQNPEEIRTLFNTRLVGEVTVRTQNKHFLSAIDNRLLSLKNSKKKKLTTDQQIKIIIANIALSCKHQGINHIFMTGSEYEYLDNNILDKIKKGLLLQNIQVEEGGNIFYDAESLKRGTEIRNVLFVEQVEESIYNEIYNELNIAKEQKNYVIGIVVLV